MIKGFGAPFSVIILLFLQACEAPRPVQKTADGKTETIAVVQPIAVTPAPVESPKPPTTPVVPRLSEADRDPQRLMKMTPGGVSSLLGKPQFVRSEAGARVWQYRAESCVLDLFLYGGASEYEVVYYEFRPSAVLSGPTQGCFEKFLMRAAS